MTGPDHFAAAARFLQRVESDDTRRLHPTDVAKFVGLAQAHATLALAAATASAGRMPGETAAAWDKATGVKR